MTNFYVILKLEVEADNVDEARALAYDTYHYGGSIAEDESESGFILSYKVEVDEV
jgi:hypothetical protein